LIFVGAVGRGPVEVAFELLVTVLLFEAGVELPVEEIAEVAAILEVETCVPAATELVDAAPLFCHIKVRVIQRLQILYLTWARALRKVNGRRRME
jgi:hypothetical protein